MRVVKVVAVVIASIVVVGCGSEDGTSTGATSPPVTTEPAATPAETTALEAIWRTEPVSPDDMEGTLRSSGLGKWVRGFQEIEGDQPDETVFVLEIQDGRWDLFREEDGAPAEPLDYDATYEVDGDMVVVSHEGDSNTYRWSVEGDTLTIEWVETTYPDHGGTPEEVFQRAFYMSGTFERHA